MSVDVSMGGSPRPESRGTTSVPALRRQSLLGDAWQRVVSFGVLLVPVAVSLTVSFFVTPQAIENGLVWLTPPCTFKTLFGIPCLSCGMTRAFSALSHGQVMLAWQYNKLSPVVYLLFWGLAAYGLRGLCRALLDLVRLR